MKKISTIILISALIAYNGCAPKESDSKTGKNWFKGNLHTHSYWSDGDEFPEVIMDWYKSKGYDFVALSDHNTLAEGEKWITLKSDSLYQNAFQNYLEAYGNSWIEYNNDSGRVKVKLKTLEEYRTRYEVAGEFLIIQSQEITDKFEEKPIHMNATNIQTRIEPQGGNTVADVLQRNIDAVLEQRAETGVPILPHINHPNFYYAITVADMIALRGERFFEVYNGHPLVHNTGDSTHMSTEEMWDLINIAYLNNNKPLMYGLATDDSHNYHKQGSSWSNAGRGWIMVESDSLDPVYLIQAIEKGRFYATTGVLLNEVSFENNTIKVEIKEEPRVTYTLLFIGCKKGEAESTVLNAVEGSGAEFKVTQDLLYVRCRIVSTKLHQNPVEGMNYEMAWTQPVTPQ